MVMDAQPSPQSVGREFVRQYYTLLNKAPNHLHRFYNNHSSFIHGGLDSHNREATLVIGQKNIHNKIQQLNFRDCHAKISQVDAQATLGNGVVVQVTGELSNDGQPMRRFTQTFVLAAQSPKKYYVHNDIFRYQDLYSDDENDGETRSDNDEEQDIEQKNAEINNQNTIGQPQQIYYSISHPAPAIAPHPQASQAVPPMQPFAAQQAQVNGVVHDELLQGIQQATQSSQIIPPPVAVVAPQQPSQGQGQQAAVLPTISSVNIPVSVNVTATHQNLNQLPSQESGTVVQENNSLVPTSHNLSPDMSTNAEMNIKPNADMKKDEFKLSDPAEKPENLNKMTPNEPKTYANLFKSITGSSSNSGGYASLSQQSHQAGSQSTNKQDQLRIDNMQAVTGSLPQRSSSNRQMKDFSDRRTSNSNSQFGDSHQLFLGNVPHHATEDELKALFSKFGTVIDLRIHSKPGSKLPGIRLPPNYGFITYEDPEAVQNCLSNCPLYFPDNSPDGQKLNVEEKKTRIRPSNDMSRLPNNNSNAGSGNMGGGSGGGRDNPQRSGTGGSNRSLSNSGGGGGGMMRGGPGSGSGPLRNSTGGGPRPSGGFTRNDSRGPGGGPGNRSGGGGNNGNNIPSGVGGGNNYGRR